MADLSYTPAFHHTDWVDRVDRVEAAGPHGFNSRFGTIESDLAGVTVAVAAIDAEIRRVGGAQQGAPPEQRSLLLTPPFVFPDHRGLTFDTTGLALVPAFSADQQKPLFANLSLPDGIRLVSMRARGVLLPSSDARSFGVGLRRTSLRLSAGAPPAVNNLAGLGVTDAGPFDITVPVQADRSIVDQASFRYALTAACSTTILQTPATGLPAGTVSLVELTYLPA
jgi:hypothetical protein